MHSRQKLEQNLKKKNPKAWQGHKSIEKGGQRGDLGERRMA